DANILAKSAAAAIASSPGPPINTTIGSGSAFPLLAGSTATLIASCRPSGIAGFSGTFTSPHRAASSTYGTRHEESTPSAALKAVPQGNITTATHRSHAQLSIVVMWIRTQLSLPRATCIMEMSEAGVGFPMDVQSHTRKK